MQYKRKISEQIYALVILLSIISCVAIYFAQQTGQYENNFVLQQILFFIVGLGICFLISKSNITFVRKHVFWFYGGAIILLLGIVLKVPFTQEVNGATRWYRLAGFSLQPSELVKGIFVFVMAHFAAKYEKNPVKQFFVLASLGLPVLLLLYKQPDLGTTIVYFVTAFTILLVANKSWKWIVGITTTAVLSVSFFLFLLLNHMEWLEMLGFKKYQFARIFTWLDPASDPDGAYQVNLSLRAIGSGMLTGRNGNVYIPESHTDMIFSSIGNQFGFIGVSCLLIVFILFIKVLIEAGLTMKKSFSTYLFAGFAMCFAFNIFENIAMSIGLMPLTGIPLPFISYGGSSILGNMICTGIMLAVIRSDSELE
ncbi:FtsW/RodA/SpoVE family cell cycle protein [Listeria aquatica]|uniref:FtsW/RodA/SpoVE family cell cycle protein n=1 Tax=Listeria aquatica TaxID=1494960 RepID=UPI003F714D89